MSRQNPGQRVALMAALAIGQMLAAGFGGNSLSRVFAPSPALRRERHWTKPHQGAQECARRRRQIAKGQLTESNGLVRE